MVQKPATPKNIIRLYQQGCSAREVSERLNIRMHTVYRRLEKSHVARRDKVASRRLSFERAPASFEIPKRLTTKQKNLALVATMLYWAEGTKRGNFVDFANSDVNMCKIFIRFLREVCRVDENRLRCLIYCHQKPKTHIHFWSNELGVPARQFTRPYVRMGVDSAKSQTRLDRMPHGLIHIRYADLKLLEQLKRWIFEFQNLWVGSEVVKRTRL